MGCVGGHGSLHHRLPGREGETEGGSRSHSWEGEMSTNSYYRECVYAMGGVMQALKRCDHQYWHVDTGGGDEGACCP